MAANPGASLLAKLKNYAKDAGVPMDTVLRRYAQERFIQLISVSPHADDFCLKGGVLMAAIHGGDRLRPTEDIDFNGYNPDGDVPRIEAMIREVCSAHDGSDGMVIDLDSLEVRKDRDGIVPGGKVSLNAFVHTARIQIKVDVGFGNVITPAARLMEIPTILPSILPPPTIQVCPLETVISEKLHAMARHGIVNTRMKDYFDLWRLSDTHTFSGADLSAAIRNTFAQHGDPVPADPEALSPDFVAASKRNWTQFSTRAAMAKGTDFQDIVDRVRQFVMPAIESAIDGTDPGDWNPEDGWTGALTPRP